MTSQLVNRTCVGKYMRLLLLVVILASTGTRLMAADNEEEVHVVRTTTRFLDPRGRLPKPIRELFKTHPQMVVKPFAGIVVEAAGGDPGRAMAMAANDGPDIFSGDIRQSVAQGLVYPLTEFIGQDGVLASGEPNLKPDGTPNLNGRIDADEAKWEGWMKLKPVIRQACTVDGIPYALPRSRSTYVGILYSTHMLEKAGLDPMFPPQSHDEFIRWCRRLYNHDKDVATVALGPGCWAFWPWVTSAGGSVIVQDRTSPTTGKVYTFAEQAVSLIAPDTGEDLAGAPVDWRCAIASEESLSALDLYDRLRWETWLVDTETGEPVTLTKADVTAGTVTVGERQISFTSEQVIEGCVLSTVGLGLTMINKIGREVSMYPLWGNDLTQFERGGVDPTDLGMMAFPQKNSELQPVLQASTEYAMLGKDVVRRGGETDAEKAAYRSFLWQMLYLVGSSAAYDDEVRQKVAAGQARFLNPRDLQRLGFDDYIRDCPPPYRQLCERLDTGEVIEMHEPFMGRSGLFGGFYEREVLGILLSVNGKDFDYRAAAKRLEHDANSGIMFEPPREELDKHRPLARVVATVVGAVMLFLLALIIRSHVRKTPSKTGVSNRWIPWLMLLPAVGSIALWSYYPLIRGLVMAFQDYQIGGRQPFVGLDNFIRIFLDPNFYHYLLTTGRFVLWSLLLAFFTPILLAILLSEVPRFKVLFRTLFFLPQMTSGLVVTLMWKEMFIGNSTGTINRLLMFLFGWIGFEPIDWLGNPSTVMACVILPGVWASAGAASLIYLAALKSVPEELYEAASMDGAGIFRKAMSITLPTLMPLIMINFVGAFIGTFQGMGSIFLLTFGGPGKETMVMAMAIWQEAYVNLRFSLATAYAWILGSILIGFTYLQLRILRRVDFRQAKGD